MYLKQLFPLLLMLVVFGCEKEAIRPTERAMVKFVDFEQSCNWNLEILDDEVVDEFEKKYSFHFLHSNIEDFNQDLRYQIGDTLTVTFEVLEENPYPQRFIVCNSFSGIPVKVLTVE